MHYHTDGAGVWSGSLGDHAIRYGIGPEADLFEHIRARDYQLPEQPPGRVLDAAGRLLNVPR